MSQYGDLPSAALKMDTVLAEHSVGLASFSTHAQVAWQKISYTGHCSAMKAIRSFMKLLEFSTPVPPNSIRTPALHPSPLSACATGHTMLKGAQDHDLHQHLCVGFSTIVHAHCTLLPC